jgi:3-oxoacyl-[acyl-carrier protein] reductase
MSGYDKSGKALQWTALVTGAASGMGREVAHLFASRAWRVIGLDINPDLSQGLAVDGRLEPVAADVRDRHLLADRLTPILRSSPALRAVVNAAGIYPASTLASYSPELYRQIFDINVLGTVNVTAVAAPHMLAAGGSVINFASIDAFTASPGQLLYSASKAAVVSLTRSLAVELAPSGVSVNAIAPGWVDTPGTRAGGRMAEGIKAVPAGRAARPEEIAEWVWTLVHGSYMTGETIIVAGGVIAR